MKKFLIALFLLTTLFVGATTLYASAQETDKVETICQTYEVAFTQQMRDQLEAQGGHYIYFTGEAAKHVVDVISEHVGPAPFDIGSFVAVLPTKDNPVVNLGYFDPNGCLVGYGKLPTEAFEKFVEQGLGRKI